MKATEDKGRLINHYEGTQGFNVRCGYRKNELIKTVPKIQTTYSSLRKNDCLPLGTEGTLDPPLP